MQNVIAENSSKPNARENATGLHGAPRPTSKIGVSSTRNHRFREWHWTFKIANLASKTCLLGAFRRQKCRLGVETSVGGAIHILALVLISTPNCTLCGTHTEYRDDTQFTKAQPHYHTVTTHIDSDIETRSAPRHSRTSTTHHYHLI